MKKNDFNPICSLYAQQVKQQAESIGLFKDSPDFRCLFLQNLNSNPDWNISLPLVTCAAAGGMPEKAIPIALSWSLLKQAAHILDHVLDNDERLPLELDQPRNTFSFYTASLFAAYRLLASVEGDALGTKVVSLFSDCGFSSVLGFNTNDGLSEDLPDWNQALERYWQKVIDQSGSIYRAATAGGGIMAGVGEEAITALGDYGTALGVILQVVDDCRDFQVQDKEQKYELSLPILLMGISSNQPLIDKMPQFLDSGLSREALYQSLEQAGVPALISSVLLKWRQHALDSLEKLPESPERSALAEILDLVLY